MGYDSANKFLFVTDFSTNRVVVYDVTAITNGENAVDLVGQVDQATVTAPTPVYTKNLANDGPNRYGFQSPTSIAHDGVNNRLFVTDGTNHRILVYAMNANGTFIDRIPDNVIGQADFSSKVQQTVQYSVNGPGGIDYDSTNNRLFVADAGSSRVLVFPVL